MAIFGCINPKAHNSTREKGTFTVRPALAQVNRNTVRHESVRQPPSHNPDNAGMHAPSLLARNMSRRNGNGAKLQKRSRVSKSMIGKPQGFEHVQHVDKDEALKSREMQDVTQVLQHSESHVQSIAKSPTMIIKHPEGGPIKTPTESGQGQPLPKDNQRPSIDGPDRRPTVNKRKAPPPITPSIIKAAGLPPSLATNAKPQLPLSATSPTRSDQAPREAQGNLNSQNKMTSVQEIYEASPRQHGRQSDGNVDGLGGLGATSPLVGLPTSSSNAPSNITEEAFHPMRSLTLQNLALSESTENVVRHADDVSSKQAHDHREVASQPSTAVATSPSGPLAYMTDSTKIRWDKGMAEIAKQLKEQDG